MSVTQRLLALEKKLFSLQIPEKYSVMFRDKEGLYIYEVFKGEKIKVYPKQEDIDRQRTNHTRKGPAIVIFDTCLDEAL